MSPCYLADATCKLFHCHKFFFPTWSSQYFTILMSPKMRKKQTMPESRACKPVCLSMSSNSFWSKIRTKVHVFAISFPSFNGKTLHRKAVEITLAWRENDLFFCLPHIFTEHLRLTRCVNLRENPPLHRLGVDSMQVGPNFRLQTLRSLMKSWYIPFNCPKHAFFRGCFTWMINQPFT